MRFLFDAVVVWVDAKEKAMMPSRKAAVVEEAIRTARKGSEKGRRPSARTRPASQRQATRLTEERLRREELRKTTRAYATRHSRIEPDKLSVKIFSFFPPAPAALIVDSFRSLFCETLSRISFHLSVRLNPLKTDVLVEKFAVSNEIVNWKSSQEEEITPISGLTDLIAMQIDVTTTTITSPAKLLSAASVLNSLIATCILRIHCSNQLLILFEFSTSTLRG